MTKRTLPASLIALGCVAAATMTGAGAMSAATASGPSAKAAARPTLNVTPSRARAGTTVTYSGRYWKARSTVTLLIGPPNSEADRFSSVRTGSNGRFYKKIRLPAGATPGRYVVLACRLQCRIKAQHNLTILARAYSASRAPTRSETRAIRAGALRALHGSGWKVSHIRVSTVSGRYRYAKAAVDNAATGVGGEMFLRGRNGRWSRVFLGTDDFCSANVPKRALRDLGFDC